MSLYRAEVCGAVVDACKGPGSDVEDLSFGIGFSMNRVRAGMQQH